MVQPSDKNNPWDEFQREIELELETSRKSLKEVSLLLEQSQKELGKLTQRNTAATGSVQQMQMQFETTSRADIRSVYSEALDAQQRLLVMRAQLDKLQSDQAGLKKQVGVLEQIQQFIKEHNSKHGANASGMATVELVINAQEAERLRLSRQMHDGPAQALSNFIIQTEIITRLFDMNPAKAKEELQNLRGAAMTTFQKVRGFIFDLRPMILDDLGLIPTLRRYIETFKEQTGADASLAVKGIERRLQPYIEVMVFRAVQELMGNAVRHNNDFSGKIQVNVQVVIDDNFVKATVADNGRGFDVRSEEPGEGLGLKLIRERTDLLGGFFEIDSRTGQGCRVTFQVPALETSVAGVAS